MKPLADAIGLWTLGLGSRVVNPFEIQVQRKLMVLAVAAVLTTPVGQYPQQWNTVRRYCYPLTVTDYHSRFLLCCEGLQSTKEVTSLSVFEHLFREYGLTPQPGLEPKRAKV